MTLTKAIELNKESERSLRSHKFFDYADAILIGNEALQRHQEQQLDRALPEMHLLPGETEEGTDAN